MSTPTIKFYYRRTKRPKLLEDDVFVLYSPQKLKFQPGEKKIIDEKLKSNFQLILQEVVDYCLHYQIVDYIY